MHQTHVSLFTTTKYNSTQNSVSRLIYNIKLSVSITIFTLIILTKSREILLSKERVIFTSKMLQPSRCNCPAGAGIKVCPTLYISLLSSLVKAVWKVNFILAIKKDTWWYKISLIVCYGSACFCCLYEQKINARNNWAIRAVMAAHGRNYKLDSCWENIKISLARTCRFLSSPWDNKDCFCFPP